MSTVTASPLSVNAPAVSWAALAYVAEKEGSRDALNAGASHHVSLVIVGEVDGIHVEHEIAGRLTIGHDSERASTSTPAVAQVVAAILGKLNAATREAVLREIPEEFAATNGSSLPAVSESLVKQAEAMLAKLRQSKRQKVRGSVKVEYALPSARPALRVVG